MYSFTNTKKKKFWAAYHYKNPCVQSENSLTLDFNQAIPKAFHPTRWAAGAFYCVLVSTKLGRAPSSLALPAVYFEEKQLESQAAPHSLILVHSKCILCFYILYLYFECVLLAGYTYILSKDIYLMHTDT